MKTFLKNFIADETGASAAEYALIIAVVGVGIGAAALYLGANVSAAIGDAGQDVYACAIVGEGDAGPTAPAAGSGC
jgi:pilus assembly protein Flp/PilA